MPFNIEYLLKFSVGLAVLYIFYLLLLRPLTFYQWNRFYLLGYSGISFFIPMINISSWLEKDNEKTRLLESFPIFTGVSSEVGGTLIKGPGLSTINLWNVAGIVIAIGACVMLCRLIIQYLSLLQLRRDAVLVHKSEISIYNVDGNTGPFSFGKSIFINVQLHTAEELQKIIRHEFIHVKQRHSLDVFVGELLCVVAWFNPFAWLIRKAIRQNLEFIADQGVLQSGLDARQYQYLLLKVLGFPQYSLTSNFNFSSLKKRIAMMNKIKTGRVHLLKFLFILPLLAVMLLAFRQKTHVNKKNLMLTYAAIVVNAADYHPMKNVLIKESNTNTRIFTDENGFFKISIPASNPSTELKIMVVKDGSVQSQVNIKWVEFEPKDSESFIGFIGINENSSGPDCKNCFTYKNQVLDKKNLNVTDLSYETVYNAFKDYIKFKGDFDIIRHSSRPIITIDDRIYILSQNEMLVRTTHEQPFLTYVNGVLTTTESINKSLTRYQIEIVYLDKTGALEKYGVNNEVIDITTRGNRGADTIPVREHTGKASPLPGNIRRIIISNEKAFVTFKNGVIERYDLSNQSEKESFEKKYGDVKPPPPPVAPAPPTNPKEKGEAAVPVVKLFIPAKVKKKPVSNKQVIVSYKNGSRTSYNVMDPREKAAFEKSYGKISPLVDRINGWEPE